MSSGAGKRRPDRSDILNSSFPFDVEREGEFSELMLICLIFSGGVPPYSYERPGRASVLGQSGVGAIGVAAMPALPHPSSLRSQYRHSRFDAPANLSRTAPWKAAAWYASKAASAAASCRR